MAKKGDNHTLIDPRMKNMAMGYSALPGSAPNTMDPRNVTSQAPIGSVEAQSLYGDYAQTNATGVVDPSGVPPSGTGNTPLGRKNNRDVIAFAQSPTQLAPSTELEMAQYNTGPGTKNKALSPMGPIGMQTPLRANLANVSTANPLALAPGNTRTKLNAPKPKNSKNKNGGIA